MFSIGFVAAQIGVSTATLRKWEERYGYPKPRRNAAGTRYFDEADLARLQQAKRLIDAGQPVSFVLRDHAERIPGPVSSTSAPVYDVAIVAMLEMVRLHELPQLSAHLRRRLDTGSLEGFVESTAAPLMRAVGDAWAAGTLQVYQEHSVARLLAELLGPVVRPTDAGTNTPTIVLTTPPGELHGLGLTMVSAALSEAGACCINLGPSLPADGIIDAASAFGADIVGLSISACSSERMTAKLLRELRDALPDRVEIWLGGAGARRVPTLPTSTRAFNDVIEPARQIRQRRIATVQN
jgi:DNA-binding transcriptional MerR regulator/methylmalonyl-CoA mutase cobalamin-binding subunit